MRASAAKAETPEVGAQADVIAVSAVTVAISAVGVITVVVFAVMIVPVFFVAAVHNGHTVVAIDRPAAVVVTDNDALGVNGTAAGGVATAVGVAGATMAVRTGFGFLGQSHQTENADKCCDDDFHISDGF